MPLSNKNHHFLSINKNSFTTAGLQTPINAIKFIRDYEGLDFIELGDFGIIGQS